MPDLLLELLSEEIPARMQAKARADLRDGVCKALKEAGVEHGPGTAWSTPRRLALRIEGLPERTPDIAEERKGPRTDAPEKALDGFLRSTGLTKEQLEIRDDKKGQVYFAMIEKPGEPLADLIARIVPDTMRGFPWPKSMRWGDGDLRWVRPLSSILCLLDNTVVLFEIGGYASGNRTTGHRAVDEAPFSVDGFAAYAEGLAARGVTLEQEAREARILERARALCAEVGVTLVEDRGLLAETAGLTEMPVPLLGEIEEAFRALPPEVLQTSMKEHQKFFSARDASGQVTHFVAVANIDAPDGGATILKGNAKVLRARLADAKFFWENDLRAVAAHGLEGMAAPLESVTFHAKLGTQAERVARVAALAREIAPAVGADPALSEQAAKVAKADLASEMVYEFPELQGLMGRYYAEAAGLDPRVAGSCEDHYKPLGPSDAVPSEPVSVAVALADKIDMLTGFWAIDEKPTGSKDPFALRRAALGVIRLVIENDVRLRLSQPAGVSLVRHAYLIEQRGAKALSAPLFDALENLTGDASGNRAAFEVMIERMLHPASGLADAFDPEFKQNIGTAIVDLLAFIADRLKVALRERGVRHDLIDAVFGLGGQDDLVLLVKRVNALQSFLATEDGANLLAGYKRAANILAAEEKKAPLDLAAADPSAETDAQALALRDTLAAARPAIDAALGAEEFETAMREMAGLRAPIDAFFEHVTVNAEDPTLRLARLALLSEIRDTMGKVASFTQVEG